MSTLSSCIKKAGKTLNKKDVKLLTDARQGYLDKGFDEAQANNKAIEDLVQDTHDKVTAYEAEIEAKGGFTDSRAYNLSEEIDNARGEYKIDEAVKESKVDQIIQKIRPTAKAVIKPKATPELITPAKAVQPPKVTSELTKQGYSKDEVDVINKGGFGKRTTSEKFFDRFAEIKKNSKAKFRQLVVDQFASFRDIMKDDRSWMLSHLTSSAPGALEATIDIGQPFLEKEGVINVDTKKKGLNELLEPLGDNLDKWTYWMAGNRANRLIKEDKEHLFDQSDIDTLIGMNKGNEALFNKVRLDFEQLNNAVTQIAVDTGLVNDEEAKQWKEEGFYLPFYRILEEGDVRGARSIGADGGLVRQQAYKKIKGGKEKLGDLMSNVLLNWNHLISASLKNQAARAALDAAVKLDIASEVSLSDKSKDAVNVRVNGEQVWYEVDDPLVLDSLLSLNWEGLNGRTMKIARAFKRALTIGVTASPEFKIRNLIRDSIHAMAVTDVSANIVKNLYQGWKSTAKGSKEYSEMLASGGSFGQSGYIHGSDPEAIKRLIKKGSTPQNIKESILDTPAKFKKIWDVYQDFGARLENINRAADYAQAIARKEDRLTAAFGARDHLDFTRTGSATSVRFIAQTVPFLNARLQGLDKLARSSPGNFKELIDPREATKFKLVIGVYSAMSVALYLTIKDDDDYKAVEEWEKRTYHLFKLPGDETMYRIPRPFEVGAIAYMAESLAQQMVEDDVHGKLFAERLGHTITETFSFNPMPQVFKPALEIAMNKNLFTGRTIESMSMANLSPVNRKRAWTSETAIGMAEGIDKISFGKVSMSPVQIEHLVRGYFGWMGAQGLAATDMLITRPLTNAPDAPAIKFSEYPVIKAFVKTTPARNTKYNTEFYERLNDINRAYADIQEARRLREMEKARDLIVKGKSLLKLRHFYLSKRKELSKINRRIKMVRLGKKNSVDKRAELDRLTVRKNRITKMVADRAKQLQL